MKAIVRWMNSILGRHKEQPWYRFKVYKVDTSELLKNKNASREFAKMIHNAIVTSINIRNYDASEEYSTFFAKFKDVYEDTYNEKLVLDWEPLAKDNIEG